MPLTSSSAQRRRQVDQEHLCSAACKLLGKLIPRRRYHWIRQDVVVEQDVNAAPDPRDQTQLCNRTAYGHTLACWAELFLPAIPPPVDAVETGRDKNRCLLCFCQAFLCANRNSAKHFFWPSRRLGAAPHRSMLPLACSSGGSRFRSRVTRRANIFASRSRRFCHGGSQTEGYHAESGGRRPQACPASCTKRRDRHNPPKSRRPTSSFPRRW